MIFSDLQGISEKVGSLYAYRSSKEQKGKYITITIEKSCVSVCPLKGIIIADILFIQEPLSANQTVLQKITISKWMELLVMGTCVQLCL